MSRVKASAPLAGTGCEPTLLAKFARQARLATVACMALALAACTTPSIPENYDGPLAAVVDSSKRLSSSSAEFYNLAEIDGKRIKDASMASREASYGRGFSLTVSRWSRSLPARPMIATLEARTQYAAPIQELTNEVFSVTGKVRFEPRDRGRYRVTGVLGRDYSAVWIEDVDTGEPVTERVETGTRP